jgi:glycosyltransferase involved in cell wall biosynthesis
MRIALIAHSNSPWAPHYSRHFLESGHALKVVSFHTQPIPGVPVDNVGAVDSRGVVPKSMYFRRAFLVRKILRQWSPDVVLATYMRSNGLVGALSKCSALVVSSRGADHDWPIPSSLNSRLVRWIGNRAEIIHASSPELAESLAARGIDKDKIEVIPLGIDTDEFVPRSTSRQSGPVRIVCTRKHFPVYDNDTIVRALALLRDSGFTCECRFASTGPTLVATQRLVRQLNLEDRVSFVGEVDSSGVVELLQWADLYVSATHSDGAPSSLFEAMSCGVFPIVTDVRANRDWITHRQNGYLCRTGQEKDWADGIRFAWKNEEIRAGAAGINRPLIIEHLNRRACLRKLDDLLARAVDIHRRNRNSATASTQQLPSG